MMDFLPCFIFSAKAASRRINTVISRNCLFIAAVIPHYQSSKAARKYEENCICTQSLALHIDYGKPIGV